MKIKRIHILLLVLIITLGLFIFEETQRISLLDIIYPSEEQIPHVKSWLEEKYGPKLYSQHDEELIIRDFFNDRRNGFFVDVGASHYENNSTTYFLEKHLGWRGIAVDALSQYKNGYLKYRKNTNFYSFFVAENSGKEVDFFINKENRRVSSGNINHALRHGEFQQVRVRTICLNDLLVYEGISKVDFLSIDIELGEPAALAGFDIRKYKPSLVCCEAHKQILDQILDYFSRNDYEAIEKYRGMDPLNLYFTPQKTEKPDQ